MTQLPESGAAPADPSLAPSHSFKVAFIARWERLFISRKSSAGGRAYLGCEQHRHALLIAEGMCSMKRST